MFSVKKSEDNGSSIYHLTDEKSGSSIAVIPACGAILHAWNVWCAKGMVNIIDQYKNIADFTQHAESAGLKSAKLSPWVCRLNNGEFVFRNKSYKAGTFFLGNHSIHGLLFRQHFEVVDCKQSKRGASIRLQYKYRKSNEGFPFSYDCIIQYQLREKNRLLLSTTIVNKANKPMPIADGWHPYFQFPEKIDELQLRIRAKKRLQFNDNLIPTGVLEPNTSFRKTARINQTIFDNCYTGLSKKKPAIDIISKAANIRLSVHPLDNYPFIQLYTPPHRNSIAIENLSSAPDAFNNGMGLIILKKGKKKTFTTEFRIVNLK